MTTPSPKTLLLVEDDDMLGPLLAEQLTALDEYRLHRVADIDGVRAALADADGIDAILIDSSVPAPGGPALCADLRANGVDCPIILLAAEGDALATEADVVDHVAKPFRIGALLARLRQLLRQAEAADDPPLRIGPYEFRAGVRTLRHDATGEETRLTDKEARILAYLHQAGGVAISREQLLDRVWNYSDGVNTHTLETHVYRLRQKMERDPANATLLVTEAGGYRLMF